MILKIGIIMGFVFLTIHSVSAQQGLTLTLGRLIYDARYIQQAVSVKNDTSNLVGTAKIECGFFSKGELIATGSTYVENIAPNAMAFKTVLNPSDISPDHAECRIVSVR
jgi:hypothetical protein